MNSNNTLLGKAGPLVFKAPVLISNLEYCIPIEYKFKLNTNVIYAKTNDNNIIINKCELNYLKNKVYFEAIIEKHLTCLSISNYGKLNTEIIKIYIPVSETLDVTYISDPIISEINADSSIKTMSNTNKENIYNELNSIYATDDSLNSSKSVYYQYINTLNLNLDISIYQTQNIFIPEPEGNVYVSSSDAPPNSDLELFKYIEVGFNPNKNKLIGKEKYSLKIPDKV